MYPYSVQYMFFVCVPCERMLVISANTVIAKYLDYMKFVMLRCRYDVVTRRHVTLATATTKIKASLDMLLFLAGLSQIVAVYRCLFFLATTSPNGHFATDCRTRFAFIFWLVSRLRQKLPNGPLMAEVGSSQSRLTQRRMPSLDWSYLVYDYSGAQLPKRWEMKAI